MIAIAAEVSAWATWMRAAGRPSSTVDLRVWNMSLVLREIGKLPADVTVDDLLELMGAKSWAPNTRRNYRASMRGFFAWMQATGRRQDNPAHLVPAVMVPRSLPRPTPEAVYYDALAGAEPRVRLMIMLAAMCGLRRGEISRLRRQDVVEDALGWVMLVKGKGGHARIVPIPEGLAVELRRRPDGWIFPSPVSASHLTPAHVGKLVAAALPDRWTCHTLRHRCATVAYQSGRDIRAVQELLGHARLDTTQLYTKVGNGAVRAAVAAAAAWAPPPPTAA